MKKYYEVGDLVFHKPSDMVGIVIGLRQHSSYYTYHVLLPSDKSYYDPYNNSWFREQLEKVYDSKTGQYCNRW